ncbi:hypothetical protein [Neptuniibacter sp.]|nr:hypothetical protein [Neptuniibacter sp.]MCP4595759.1 hypothetical protein [Neptuniibacter sp.]
MSNQGGRYEMRDGQRVRVGGTEAKERAQPAKKPTKVKKVKDNAES